MCRLSGRLLPRRALASLAAVLVVLGSTLLGAGPAAARPELAPVVPAHGATVWVAPADDATSAVRVAFLHGMCMDPRRTCERVRDGVGGWGLLACPTGNGACGGGADWRGSGEEKAAHLDAALGAAWRHLDAAGQGGDVLVGFSRGAFVARDVAYARPGRFRALVLIGAALVPDVERLVASGVRRIVFASGDFDPARRTMQRAAAEMTAGGLPARFVSLGPIGHALPADVDRNLGPHLRWAAAAPASG